MSNKELYTQAFAALFVGPKSEDVVGIVKMLADHSDFCTRSVRRYHHDILEDFAEDLLFDHVQKQTNGAIGSDLIDGVLNDDQLEEAHMVKLEIVVRNYCDKIGFVATTKQVTNLVDFFDNYFDLG